MKFQNKSRNPIGQKLTAIIGNKLFKKILFIVPALLGVGAVFYALWLHGVFLPHWITWNHKTFWDQSGAYEIQLNHKSVQVLHSGNLLWTSPNTIKVQEALCCDIDNDNTDELILLCWKIGRFGRHKPFWVEKMIQTGHSIFSYMKYRIRKSSQNGCPPISVFKPAPCAQTAKPPLPSVYG